MFTIFIPVPLPPTLLYARIDSNSITVLYKQPNNYASSYNISHYIIQVRPVSANSTGIPVYHSYTNMGVELQNNTIEDLIPDTLYEVVIASESHVGMGRFSVNHLLVLTTSFGKFIQ